MRGLRATTADPTIVLPNDWTSQPDGTASTDTIQYQATVTATSPGLGSGTLTWLESVNGGAPASEARTILIILGAIALGYLLIWMAVSQMNGP